MAAVPLSRYAAFNGSCASTATIWGLADVGAFKSKACTSAGSCKIFIQVRIQPRNYRLRVQDTLQLSFGVRASSLKKEQLKIKRKRPLEPVERKPESLEDLNSSSAISQGKCDHAEQQGNENLEQARESLPMVGRGRILSACVLTSAGISGAGLLLRQVSHWAADSGFSVPDCTVVMPYTVDQSQIGVVTLMVVVVSSLRQLLLRVWPDFRQASISSNEQILGSLEPVDYVVVSSLPGISEEFLFRGALLPLVGVDWKGAVVAGLVFGALHLSGGRNAAFAVWASAIGITYGLVSVYSQSLVPPMAIHSLANLMSVAIWRVHRDQ